MATPEPENPRHLRRELGLYPATALVVGSVIGSGIFVSSAAMARQLPSGWQLLAVWAVAGALTAFGALTQSELCSRLPVSGGLMAYFRELLGPTVAFFYGWANLAIAASGAIAALALVFAGHLCEMAALPATPDRLASWPLRVPLLGTLYPLADLAPKALGTALVLGLTALNVRGVRLGSRVQSLSATAKTLALFAIVAAALLARDGSFAHLRAAAPAGAETPPLFSPAAWFIAMGGAFWAYDGWGNVANLGDEVRDPARNLPRAILLGAGLAAGIYVLANLAYLYVLPLAEIGQAPGGRVAAAALSRIWGGTGAKIISALILLAVFDTANAAILSNARIYYAMATDGLFPRAAGRVHPVFATPHIALWLQAAWSIVLLVTGSFELVAAMYIFVNWAFYALIPLCLFVARRRGGPVPVFAVPLYPLIPALFALFTLAYLTMTLVGDLSGYLSGNQPVLNSLMGIVLVLTGSPIYLWMKLKARRGPN